MFSVVRPTASEMEASGGGARRSQLPATTEGADSLRYLSKMHVEQIPGRIFLWDRGMGHNAGP